MSRPMLFLWLTRWFWGGVLVFTIFALGLTAANLVDYFPFGLALHRVHRLNTDDLRAMATACILNERVGYHHVRGRDIPPEFRSLKPIDVSFYPGSSDVTLLQRDDLQYIFLRISTNSENQTIRLVDCSSGRQRTSTLWERNPESSRRMNPSGRLVTLSQTNMHEGREWIVGPDELLVVERPYTVGNPDRIVLQVPLTPEQRDKIETALFLIPADVRGHVYDGGSTDGYWLRIASTPDGSEGDDVLLKNIWIEAVGPLVEAVSSAAGIEHAISFPDHVRQWSRFAMEGGPLVRTLKEQHQREDRIPLAWWCVWPRLVSR